MGLFITTYNKILPNFNRLSIGGAYNFYKKIYLNVAYSYYYDKDMNIQEEQQMEDAPSDVMSAAYGGLMKNPYK